MRDGTGGERFAAGTVEQRAEAFRVGESTVTCNVRSDPGNDVPGTDFWLQGSMQPWILPDPARPGNEYVVANDDADVVIARSTDHGRVRSARRLAAGAQRSLRIQPATSVAQ
ncbi:hypothetical protein ACFV2Q_29625 [Streptomyces sp. NPDC059650]|uniref:hypothetical protein n=1 Tax=Streptomyces sp. NPDC059650 TaxID=3346896 RepID=UPI003674FC2C